MNALLFGESLTQRYAIRDLAWAQMLMPSINSIFYGNGATNQ